MNIFADIILTTVYPLTFSHHSIDGLPLTTRGVDVEGRPLSTVYVPASMLRGRLRNEAAMAHLRRNGKTLLGEAYLLALGQDIAPEENEEPEAIRLGKLQAQRDAQPILDLFGTWKMGSRLLVPHLLPEINLAPESFSGIRLDLSEEVVAMLDDQGQQEHHQRIERHSQASKVVDQIKVVKRTLGAARRQNNEALIKELQIKLDELGQDKALIKGDDNSNNSKHLLQIQAIPAGIELRGQIVVSRARPRDLPIMMDGLDGLSRFPVMGGSRARGFGRVSLRATLSDDQGRVLLEIQAGDYKPAQASWTEAGRDYVGQHMDFAN